MEIRVQNQLNTFQIGERVCLNSDGDLVRAEDNQTCIGQVIGQTLSCNTGSVITNNVDIVLYGTYPSIWTVPAPVLKSESKYKVPNPAKFKVV